MMVWFGMTRVDSGMFNLSLFSSISQCLLNQSLLHTHSFDIVGLWLNYISLINFPNFQ